MSVEEVKVIDFVTITAGGDYLLTIADHLPWESKEHLFILQEKLNTYISFIESNEIYDLYPEARGCKIIINLMYKYPLNGTNELKFLKEVENALKNIGIVFKWEHSSIDS
ncbi:DUF6572 domain-containing protein [Acinetobacter sp. X9]|uniref:DUF6572 domain-containing protein n=1 Tax=Acinetobacter pittii TaxID=48296 RepID=UPI0032618C46